MMKRQLIQSAAAFFVIPFGAVETLSVSHDSTHQCVNPLRLSFLRRACILTPSQLAEVSVLISLMVMVALTDFLLLAATGKLCAERICILRNLLSALVGGLYVGACCVLPLGHWALRLFSRCILCLIAFGLRKDLWRKILIFIALTAALECASDGGGDRLLPLALSAAAVVLLTLDRENRYLPVELNLAGKSLKLTALFDTGNALRDPITGREVLVVGAETAETLLGLSADQLRKPLETIGLLPGLRLIPYKTISGRGFLLAMPMQNVKIGSYRGSSLVAFSPESIGNGNYQALTGGL